MNLSEGRLYGQCFYFEGCCYDIVPLALPASHAPGGVQRFMHTAVKEFIFMVSR